MITMLEFIHMIMYDINLAEAYRARLIHHINVIRFQSVCNIIPFSWNFSWISSLELKWTFIFINTAHFFRYYQA